MVNITHVFGTLHFNVSKTSEKIKVNKRVTLILVISLCKKLIRKHRGIVGKDDFSFLTSHFDGAKLDKS